MRGFIQQEGLNRPDNGLLQWRVEMITVTKGVFISLTFEGGKRSEIRLF